MEEAAGTMLANGLNGPKALKKLYLEMQWWHQAACAAVLKPLGNPDNEMPLELIDFGFLLDVHTTFLKVFCEIIV